MRKFVFGQFSKPEARVRAQKSRGKRKVKLITSQAVSDYRRDVKITLPKEPWRTK